MLSLLVRVVIARRHSRPEILPSQVLKRKTDRTGRTGSPAYRFNLLVMLAAPPYDDPVSHLDPLAFSFRPMALIIDARPTGVSPGDFHHGFALVVPGGQLRQRIRRHRQQKNNQRQVLFLHRQVKKAIPLGVANIRLNSWRRKADLEKFGLVHNTVELLVTMKGLYMSLCWSVRRSVRSHSNSLRVAKKKIHLMKKKNTSGYGKSMEVL